MFPLHVIAPQVSLINIKIPSNDDDVMIDQVLDPGSVNTTNYNEVC